MRYPKPAQRPFSVAGELLRKRAEPDDAIAFGGTRGGQYHLRLGLAYATRNEKPLRDVFAKQTAASKGSFKASECKDVKECPLNDVSRLWLLTPGEKRVDLAEMPPFKAQMLRSQFVIRQTWPLGRHVLALLERHEHGQPETEQFETPSSEFDEEPTMNAPEP
jgi:hypothetical protein